MFDIKAAIMQNDIFKHRVKLSGSGSLPFETTYLPLGRGRRTGVSCILFLNLIKVSKLFVALLYEMNLRFSTYLLQLLDKKVTLLQLTPIPGAVVGGITPQKNKNCGESKLFLRL